MQEIWKDVKGYEGLYQVSATGKVKSLRNNEIRKTKKNNRGYVQIALYNSNADKYFLLHRIVADAFIENPNKLPQVNHKDENKENNAVDNLEWCTNLYNRRYGTGYQRSVINHDYKRVAKLNSKPVKQCDEKGNLIKTFYGVKEAERQTGIGESNIRKSIREGYYAGGYKWEYAKTEDD